MARVFEPSAITILCTNRCTAECRHCCMNSGPARKETLSGAQLQHILGEIFRELPRLYLIVFAGGEPTLLGEDLHRAIALCKQHGRLSRLVTNGFWASSPKAARETVAALRAAGLDELNLSTDDYHLPYISLQRLQYAWEAAKEAGFLSVVLANCAGPESWLSPQRVEEAFGGDGLQRRFDGEGRSNELRPADGRRHLAVLSNANVQRIGRGLAHLRDSELPPMPLSDLVQQGGCPWAVRSAAISPGGHLLACCGFELEGNPILDYGDLGERPLAELLDRADEDLITNMIAIYGPPLLKQLLERLAPDEVEFPRSYRSYCEVCSDLVLLKKNRDALYRHQGSFLEAVLSVRERLTERYRRGDRVELPLELLIQPAEPVRG